MDYHRVTLTTSPWTFESKVIAKTVALPNLARAATGSSGQCHLPLSNPRLRAIGQINLNFQANKAFQGEPLEITHFAMYWKAMSQFDSHANALTAGSCLLGKYVRLFVVTICLKTTDARLFSFR